MSERESVWRQPGMAPLVAMTTAGFSGYALLLTVAPLWAVHGGASAAGAGLVNGVLLSATVLTQLAVPRALRTLGWGPVLSVGLLLMGLGGASHAVSDALAVVLALSAVRGVGFGVLTVTGSAAVAALVGERRRGEAIGVYGLAVAVPNVVLLPLGPWVAGGAGFWPVFALSALPLLGIPAAVRLASALQRAAAEEHVVLGRDDEGGGLPVYRPLVRPVLLLLAVTAAGGAVLTFVPQVVPSTPVAVGGLFLMGLSTALSRWRAGVLGDRHGAQRLIAPLVPLTGVGMGLVAWSVGGSHGTRTAGFLVAMVLLGLCYGALQNLTLVVAFAAVPRRHRDLASAWWNVGFDAGTALGSVAVGAIAQATSFTTAFLVMGVLAATTLPLALGRSRVAPGTGAAAG